MGNSSPGSRPHAAARLPENSGRQAQSAIRHTEYLLWVVSPATLYSGFITPRPVCIKAACIRGLATRGKTSLRQKREFCGKMFLPTEAVAFRMDFATAFLRTFSRNHFLIDFSPDFHLTPRRVLIKVKYYERQPCFSSTGVPRPSRSLERDCSARRHAPSGGGPSGKRNAPPSAGAAARHHGRGIAGA